MTNDQQIWLSLCCVGNGHVGILLFIVGLKREQQNGPGNLGAEAGKGCAVRIRVFLFPCLIGFAPAELWPWEAGAKT